MAADVAGVRAVAERDGLPGPMVWVVVRRSVSDPAERTTHPSHASAETPRERLGWAGGRRRPVEPACRERTSATGMDHDEAPGWVGRHHHLTMRLPAHHVLVRLRRRLGEIITGADRSAGAAAAARHSAPATV
ncbi:MAG: hypothetical protein U0531_07370 [Dehalococcoidia bacterium]